MVDKENKRLMLIKTHYFFFMAAMGPILPQISVFGKQLNIPADVMGYVFSVLPLVYILVKLILNLLGNYFKVLRKFIFILMIITMTLGFGAFYFIPHYNHTIDVDSVLNFTIHGKDIAYCDSEVTRHETRCTKSRLMNCANQYEYFDHQFYVMTIDPIKVSKFKQFFSQSDNKTYHFCMDKYRWSRIVMKIQNFSCTSTSTDIPYCDEDMSFWMYVILLCLGTVGFNVTKSITDAMYFAVPKGYNEEKHWSYRVWGAIGFGATALLGGISVHFWTTDTLKSFTPALFVMVIFIGFELLSIYELKVPQFSSTSLFRDSCNLLRERKVVLFLGFAIMAGILDSFINFFIFWHLEDIAEETGYMGSIKLIEGCVIAAGCFCGELIVLLNSDKIIKKIGGIHCLSICFYLYAIRLLLIALIPSPWWFVAVELVMQGCTHALTCACIRTYASTIAPPGASATAQELGAGMKDRLGYIIGPLIGGKVYKDLGGPRSFLVFSGIAIVVCFCHNLLRPGYKYQGDDSKPDGYLLITEEQTEEDLEHGKR